MTSNPLFIICTRLFFCIFQTNLAMATLALKEMDKFLWEGREKVLPSWLSQFSKTKLRQPIEPIWQPFFSLPWSALKKASRERIFLHILQSPHQGT